MRNLVFLFLLILIAAPCSAQVHVNADTIHAPAQFDNIFSKPVSSDSLSSVFVIFIKKEVKKHKHAEHTEQVVVLEGSGEMLLGDKQFKVTKGDVIQIPKGTVHALKVGSKEPMKVLSIQSPYFDGKDRILIE